MGHRRSRPQSSTLRSGSARPAARPHAEAALPLHTGARRFPGATPLDEPARAGAACADSVPWPVPQSTGPRSTLSLPLTLPGPLSRLTPCSPLEALLFQDLFHALQTPASYEAD